MTLESIIKPLIKPSVTGNAKVEITKVVCDSREVAPQSCYVAIKGTKLDGHRFIDQAIQQGAVAIIAEIPCTKEARAAGVTWVEVNNTREALGLVASAFYEFPSKDLRVIGVTGTNGKTTSAYIAHSIMKKEWFRAGLIGTIVNDNGSTSETATQTTPGPIELQALLAQMRKNGCRGVAMEVSSHAIDQDRVSGIEFDAMIFTNLTQDHLDYHGNMENYFMAKAKIFAQLCRETKGKRKPTAIINIDDPYGKRLVEMIGDKMNVKTFGCSIGADFRMTFHQSTARSSEFKLDYKGKTYLVRVPLIGKFNMYNCLGALAATVSVGIPIRDVITHLTKIPQVPGRMELIPHARGFQIFIDYAHTPDAISNVCRTLKDLTSDRLITVFGCGGDRDAEKRPLMGKAAAALSSLCVVTSDNPRSENPDTIIKQILAGMPAKGRVVIPDRDQAITAAIMEAQAGDTILIAGKGHESYQIIGDETLPFSDVSCVLKAFRLREEHFNKLQS